MKKILLLAGLFMISCSSDSGSGSDVPLPSKITLSGVMNQVYNFTYDGQHRVTKINYTGFDADVLDLTYDGDKLTGITSQNSDDYTFIYNGNGMWTGLTINGSEIAPVSYNSVADTYNLSGLELAFNPNWDIRLYDTDVFTYETSNKGAFYNVGAPITLTGLFGHGNLIFCTGKMPLSSTPLFSLTHTYNDEGYIVHSADMGGNQTIDYEY